MQITCENCRTVFEMPREQIGKLACPFCEHMNVPKGVAPSKASFGKTPRPAVQEEFDHNRTMMGSMDALAGSESTLIQTALAGRSAGLPADQEAALVVLDGAEKGTRFRLDKIETVIGRKGADVCLSDPEISRRHCVIRLYGDIAVVADLGSSNGVRLRDQIVKEGLLKPLDKFEIGGTVIQFALVSK